MYRLLLAFSLLLLAAPAYAQFTTDNEPLTVSVEPANPRPYQTVTVTPDSSLLDLVAGTMSVSVNGKLVEKGTGVQSVPVTVGGPGERTTISVTAVVAGQSYTRQLTLRPADVSLILEPVSTTHPFYSGAPLTAPLGRVRVVALADLRTAPGTRLSPGSLAYTWRQGDKVLASESGIGKSTLLASAPMRYRDAQITVTVASVDGSLVAEETLAISPVDPIVRLYATDPLMGPDFDHALSSSFTMSSEEQAFRGVAYFFGTAPSLAWSVGGQSASNDNEVTVRTTGSGEGTANVSLVAATSDTQQSVTAQLPVSFGAKKSTNIFGF